MCFNKNPRKTNSSYLAKLRVSKGLTQAQLAELAGVQTSLLGAWELGTRNPKTSSLLKLASALDVSVEELVNGIYKVVDNKVVRKESTPISESHIAKARRRAGITQAKLAEMIGSTQSSITHYEKHVSSPSIEQLEKIAHALGVPIDELIDGEDE